MSNDAFLKAPIYSVTGVKPNIYEVEWLACIMLVLYTDIVAILHKESTLDCIGIDTYMCVQ